MSDDERVNMCPKCGTTGHAIHEVDDRQKILYQDGITTVYAKKMQCANCGAEWSASDHHILLNGMQSSSYKTPSSDDIISAFIISVKQDNPSQFETFSESDWRCAARYMLTKHNVIENDSTDAEYLRYAEFMDFLDNEARKKVPGYEENQE
jgi:hypothetical protein